MKFDKNDTNTLLGIFAIGIFLSNLGFFLQINVKKLTTTFFNGFIKGACVGLEIIGIFLIFYGILGIIKINKNK